MDVVIHFENPNITAEIDGFSDQLRLIFKEGEKYVSVIIGKMPQTSEEFRDNLAEFQMFEAKLIAAIEEFEQMNEVHLRPPNKGGSIGQNMVSN